MRKALSVIAATAAVLPVFWATVVQNPTALCKQPYNLSYHPDSESGKKGAEAARKQLCNMIADYPSQAQ
jgi:hypothetical protein